MRPESYRFIIYYTILDDARTMMQGIPLYDPGRGQDDEVRNTSSVQDDGGVVQNDEERLLKVIF